MGVRGLKCRRHFFIVMSQLIVAYLIEVMGLFGVEKEPLEWRRVAGMVIALIGVAIFQWK